MSVAPEFPPVVYIPERARRTATSRGAAERHLALVPAGGGQVTRPLPVRPVKSNFNHGGVEWPLTVAPAARPLRLTRRGLVVAILGTLLAGLAMLLVAHASAHSPAATPKVAAGASMTVRPGDTLWSIAQRVEPNRDPRLVVDQLRRLNHLTSVSLSAGQTLKLS